MNFLSFQQLVWVPLFVFMAVFCSGCGGEKVYIAHKAKFRVSFSKKLVQISYDLNPDYQVKIEKRITYEDLGNVFLTWSEELRRNDLGSQLHADPEILVQPHPVHTFKKFPNGATLPASIPSRQQINEWKMADERLQISLMYGAKPEKDLVVGGAILSDQFQAAPRELLATQDFKAANGDVVATITFAGPTKNSLGGLYFFGNFGIMPFEEEQNLLRDDPPADEISWFVLATEPAHLVTPPKDWIRWYSPRRLIQALMLDIESFNGTTVFPEDASPE